MFTATRKIDIDAAHRVPEHGSKCRNLHGHRYTIEMTIAGTLRNAGAETGMVMDFGFMKELLLTNIDARADHGLMLWWNDPLVPTLPGLVKDPGWPADPTMHQWAGGKLWLLPDVPTAENLARIFYHMLASPVMKLTEGRAFLREIKVHETANCWATFHRFSAVGTS